jgi:hypothetical protein
VKLDFARTAGRPKREIRRLTTVVGVGPSRDWTQVFSFPELQNTMEREGLWLDGAKSSSKELSYPPEEQFRLWPDHETFRLFKAY